MGTSPQIVQPRLERAVETERSFPAEWKNLNHGTRYCRIKKVYGGPDGQTESLQNEVVSAVCREGEDSRLELLEAAALAERGWIDADLIAQLAREGIVVEVISK